MCPTVALAVDDQQEAVPTTSASALSRDSRFRAPSLPIQYTFRAFIGLPTAPYHPTREVS
jgi:hypothetical protein